MYEELFTVNGLADELKRDRRTVRKYLDSVPPDGMVKGKKAWTIETALDNMPDIPRQFEPPDFGRSQIITDLCDRLTNWHEIFLEKCVPEEGESERPDIVGLEAIANAHSVPLSVALRWARSGMPVIKHGNWETGESFELVFHQANEWVLLVEEVLILTQDVKAQRFLKIGQRFA
jgi:hypothetical protein